MFATVEDAELPAGESTVDVLARHAERVEAERLGRRRPGARG